VTLDILDGDEIVPIEQSTGSTALMSVNWLGRRTPVHCTASGKVILAFAADPIRHRLLARALEPVTGKSIVDVAELDKQLAAAREAGYARTFEELEMGLDAVAAPVYSADGDVVAAIDVSGPAHRLQAGGGPDFVGLTKDAAADVSRRLGFRGRPSR
jgi:DNA-binding IclR family transcriptional regulator